MGIIENTLRWDDNTAELLKNLKQAVKEVEGVRDAAKGAGSEWDKFVGGFKIEDAINKPLESAKAGSLALADSIGGVALAASAAVASVVAIGAAIFKLASDAAATGAELDDLSDKTGMSVPVLDKYRLATKVIGGDLNQLTDIVFKLEKGIGDNTEKFQEGLAKMGLSTEQLRKAGPDQYLELIVTGLNSIPDASDRAAAGTAVLGKGFKDVAATLKDLQTGLDMTNDITPWTAEQAADAEKFEQQMASIWVHAEALAMGLGRTLIPAVSATVDIFKTIGEPIVTVLGYMSGLTQAITGVTAAWDYGTAAIRAFRGEAEKLPEPTGAAKKGVDEWQKSVKALALQIPSTTKALSEENIAGKELTATAKEHIAALQKEKKAGDDWRKVLKELDSVGGSYIETLDSMDGATVEGIKHYLEAGVSQKVLADAYGVTDSQIKAVVTSLQEEKKWYAEVEREHEVTRKLALDHEKEYRDEQSRLLKKSNEETARSIVETGKLWGDYYDLIDKETLSTTDYQLKQVQRWFDDEVAKLKDDDAAWGLHYDALYAVADRRMKDITNLNDPFYRAHKQLQEDLEKDWNHFLDDIAGGFTKTFSVDIVDVLFGDKGFKDVWHDLGQMLKNDLKAILSDILNNVIQGFVSAAAAKLGGFLAGLVGLGKGGGSSLPGWLLALIPGLGGGGNTAITSGYWDQNGNWVPVENTGQPGGGLFPNLPENPQHDSAGGIIGHYASGFPGEAMGTDIVPAWLTPGEGILNRHATSMLGEDGIAALNRGEMSSNGSQPTVNNNYYIQAVDVDSFRRLMDKQGIPYVLSELRHNRRGARSDVAEVVS